MASFDLTAVVTEGDKVSAALGVDASNKLDSNDNGKAVKLGVAQNYVLCATGDDIEGFQVGVEAHTVNDGFSFGSVQTGGTIDVEVAAAEIGTASVGSYVVSGIPIARNTAGAMQVILGAGSVFKWRVIKVISGTGVAGDSVRIQRAA